MKLNNVYEDLWNVGTLLQTDEALSVLQADYQPWPKVKEETEESRNFYKVHDRDKQAASPYLYPQLTFHITYTFALTYLCFQTRLCVQTDLARLREYYETRETLENYVVVLKKFLGLFGSAIHESLTRTMGNYLEVTNGRLANSHKSEWEKEIAGRMTCTNNQAKSPFATVRAFLDIYPRYSYPQPCTCTNHLHLHLTLTVTWVLHMKHILA